MKETLPYLGRSRKAVNGYPLAAHWYCQLGHEGDVGAVPHTTRLTIWIDRQDMSRTQSARYAPLPEATDDIPETAWTEIQPPREPPGPIREKG